MKSYKEFIRESNQSDKFDVIEDSNGYNIIESKYVLYTYGK